MPGRTAKLERETNDEIEAVLGRFQKWTASKRDESRADSMPMGVRELSYEEALASSRSRWTRHNHPAEPPADAASPQSPLRTEPGVIPVAAPAVKPSPEPVPRPEIVKEPEADAGVSAFRSIITETVQPRKAMKGTVLPKENSARSPQARQPDRLVKVTVRMAASEQALIRMRAAAAGLSAPAYLRQCAIEVEVLRAQVEQLMAAATRSRLAELTAPAPPPAIRDGWWTRWRRSLNPGRTEGRPGQLSLGA